MIFAARCHGERSESISTNKAVQCGEMHHGACPEHSEWVQHDMAFDVLQRLLILRCT